MTDRATTSTATKTPAKEISAPKLARDVMRSAHVSVQPADKLEVAERLLVEHRLTGLPVLDGGKLAGIISSTDIARVRVLAESLDGQIAEELHWDETQADGFKHPEKERFLGFATRLDKLHVRDVMRRQVFTCRPDAPLAEAASLMARNNIHRVFVVEAEKPVGVIGSLDLVALLAK